MNVYLSKLANFLKTKFSGMDVEITGVSTDTRTLKSKELFLALQGERFDGHDYIDEAIQRGAAAILVSRPGSQKIPTILVENTHTALMQLARHWRLQFDLPVVAITGSCGKTSTRALLQSILSGCGTTLASERSFNNNIGVPLTLLKLNSQYEYAVFEVGANHSGEIAELIALVKPTVAVLTNAAAAHLAGFGSVEGVARAKAEIFQGLAENGVAVFNADDAFADYWRSVIKTKSLSFGLNNKADIRASALQADAKGCYRFKLETSQGVCEVQLGFMGKHNVYNALAAAAAATALNISLEKIAHGLQNASAETRRLNQQKGLASATVIDDSYNANPASVLAAIAVLADRPGVSVLVLGDMLELGNESEEWHRKIGQAAKSAGIRHLFCYGPNTEKTVAAFGNSAAKHFSTREALTLALKPLLNEQVTVLIKGSNAMGMNQITQSLLQE